MLDQSLSGKKGESKMVLGVEMKARGGGQIIRIWTPPDNDRWGYLRKSCDIILSAHN